MKRAISLLLAIVMVIGMLPMPVGADAIEVETVAETEVAELPEYPAPDTVVLSQEQEAADHLNVTSEDEMNQNTENIVPESTVVESVPEEKTPVDFSVSDETVASKEDTIETVENLDEIKEECSISESVLASNIVQSGTCGSDITWTLYSDGLLNISGTGEIHDRGFDTSVPWYEVRETITDVFISREITRIGNEAFHGCINLTSISIPDTVISIGWNAFAGCADLKSITIPDSVTSIGGAAFQDCTSLKNISLPYGIESLEDYLFSGCTVMEAITVPYGVTSIGSDVFRNCASLTSIELPQCASSIGYRAFLGCTALSSVVIPNGVAEIQANAFKGCTALTAIALPDSVINIGHSVFSDCTGLKNIKLSQSVVSIEPNTFTNCKSLTNLTLPDSITSIGNNAFSDCSSLRDVTLSRSVNSIGSNAFSGCSSLAAIDIPESVISIGVDAFRGCSSLKDVTLSCCVTSIENGVFRDCSSLMAIDIPDSVTTIGNWAFGDCTSLTAIDIPTSVTTIGTSAFRDCTGLISCTIPDSVNKIDSYAFLGCSSLKSIRIPESVTVVSVSAFEDCDSLSEVIFMGNAPAIGVSVFHSVTAIAYYPEDNITWTEDVMEDYGGNITWVSYAPKDVNTTFIDNLSVICYANQKTAENPDEKFLLAPNVTATVGSEIYQANSQGQITISGKPQDTVTFSLDNYVSRTFTLQELSDHNVVRLQKPSDSPIIYELRAGGMDILHQELAISYASENSVSLTPDIDWGESGMGSLILSQENKSLPLKTGKNYVKLASEFDINEEIYLVAQNSNGKQAKKLLKIKNKAESGLEGFTFDLSDSLSFTLPESAGILAGLEMNLGMYSPVPVEVTVEDGKVYAAFGIQLDVSQDDEGKTEIKNAVSEIKKLRNAVADCIAGLEDYKYVRDVMKNFGHDNNWKATKIEGSCGVEGHWSILGYVEGYLDENNNVIIGSSGGVLSFGASKEWTTHYLVGNVPVFFEFSFSGDIENQFNLYINQQIQKFTPQIEAEGVVVIQGGMGVGLAKVGSLSGGIKGSFLNKMNYYQGMLNYYKLTAALDWYLKLQLLCLSYSVGDTIKEKVWYEYPDPGSAVMALGLDDEAPAEGGGKPDLYDTSKYTMDDLSYLESGSSFMGGGAATFSARPLNNNAPFVANAYEGADPQTAFFSDGTRLAVWVGYNEKRSGADALNLYYSYYNGAWGQPQLVEDDGTIDSNPDLKIINDTAYLVWQDAASGIGNNADLDSMAPLMEISGAVFHKETESFTTGAVTSGSGVLNMQPKLCGDSSGGYVVWHRNTENDWFGQNNANSLLRSEFTGGSWSAPTVLYSGLGPILDFDVTCSGGSCTVAYTLDGDGDLNTTEDLEVYKNGVALTDNEYLDSGVTFSGTDLYWYSGGRLVKNGSNTMPEDVFIGSDRFQILNENGVHAVVYAEEEGLASTLKVAYYDASSGGWGTPKTLYDAGTSISAFSAVATSEGEISVLIQSQTVTDDFDGTDPYGTVDLVWYNAPMGCDIRVDDVRYYNENYVQYNNMPVYITVTNTGELAVQKLQVQMTDENGTVVETETVQQQILSGETKEIQISYYVKEIVSGKKLTLNVVPVGMEDAYLEDNAGELLLGWEDLSVEDLRAGVMESGAIILHASIVNRGYNPQNNVTVYLREQTESGTVLETIELESIGGQSRQAVSFTLENADSQVYYITIDRKETDSNSVNNSDFINISDYKEDNHVYETVVTKATCTERGYTSHICTVCGSSYVDNYVDALGHSYEEGKCTACGEPDPDYSAAEKIASGWSGDLTWVLTDDGVLTFSGTGAMKNYGYKSEMPWYKYIDQITSVVLNEGVTRIGDYAFYGMTMLETIDIADTVTYIGDFSFKGSTALDGVVLPPNLSNLGTSAFYGCTGLTSIEIPASLYTVKPYAFKNCSSLSKVTFHEGNLMKLSDGSFYGTALTEVEFPKCLDIIDVYCFKNCFDLASITIPQGDLTQIREAVFYATAISSFTIPEGVTKVGPYAFKNCVNLKTVSLPATLTSVGEASFYACTGLQGITIPDAVTSIGDYAFRKCAAMTEVNLGRELTDIGLCAFYGCSGLTNLEIPDKVTTIQGYAFKGCIGLTSMNLGSSVETLGESAFHTCTALKTLELPASLKTIGDYCFSGSYNLWQLTFTGNAPSIGSGAFKSLAATANYPANDSTWTSDVMQNYGGSIAWKAVGE